MNKVLFWDFDGTLVYSNESFVESLTRALADYEYSVEKETVRNFMKNTCSWYMPEKEYTDRTGELWWEDIRKKFSSFCAVNNISGETKVPVFERFKNYAITYSYKPYEDAGTVLEACRKRGFQNYILSNNFPELRDTVREFHWEHLFTDYFLSTEIGYEKPRTEIFDYALEKSGNPEIVFMIGDNPVADIKGAKEAGIPAILVHRNAPDCGADASLKELTDLLNIL